MNMTNNTGPSIEPCGIPLVTLLQLETDPSTLTLWHLFERNDFNHPRIFPWMPYVSSLLRRCTCGTESNALEKFVYITSIISPNASPFVQSRNTASSWVMHDRPGTNPCWSSENKLFAIMCSRTASLIKASMHFATIDVRLTGL